MESPFPRSSGREPGMLLCCVKPRRRPGRGGVHGVDAGGVGTTEVPNKYRGLQMVTARLKNRNYWVSPQKIWVGVESHT
jgi:hypothetical protein